MPCRPKPVPAGRRVRAERRSGSDAPLSFRYDNEMAASALARSSRSVPCGTARGPAHWHVHRLAVARDRDLRAGGVCLIDREFAREPDPDGVQSRKAAVFAADMRRAAARLHRVGAA